MTNKRRSSGLRAPPKLFQCTGYGDCSMVFTRSEHLARHERKHTGEKPYECIVPGCDRMFSRFDNMMQHTQTHEKNNKSSRNFCARSTSSQRPLNNPVDSCKIKGRQQNEDKGQYVLDATNTSDNSSMVNSRTLPPPSQSSSVFSYSSSNFHKTLNSSNRASYPSAFQNSVYFDTPRNRTSWPLRRESYLPQLHPYNCSYNDTDVYHRRSSVSTVSSESSLISPLTAHFPVSQGDPKVIRRRISVDDLCLPIENLKNICLDEKMSPNDDVSDSITVDITSDEFEALEGFSRFHSTTIVIPTNSCATEQSIGSSNQRGYSPNFASQVCAMRQRVMTSNESYKRG